MSKIARVVLKQPEFQVFFKSASISQLNSLSEEFKVNIYANIYIFNIVILIRRFLIFINIFFRFYPKSFIAKQPIENT